MGEMTKELEYGGQSTFEKSSHFLLDDYCWSGSKSLALGGGLRKGTTLDSPGIYII